MSEDTIKLVRRKFRTAYALKPGFRFGALRKHCDNITFATDGFVTELDSICEQLNQAFADFDPKLDCIVPVGTALVNHLAGVLIAQRFPQAIITLAVFRRGEGSKPEEYVFYDVPINLIFPQIPRKEQLDGLEAAEWNPVSSA